MRTRTRPLFHRAHHPRLVARQIQIMVLHPRHRRPGPGAGRLHCEDVLEPEEPVRGDLFRDSVFLHRCGACYVQCGFIMC